MKRNKKQKINIVWLKRDIRVQDHLPLYMANNQKTPYIVVYIFDSDFCEFIAFWLYFLNNRMIPVRNVIAY